MKDREKVIVIERPRKLGADKLIYHNAPVHVKHIFGILKATLLDDVSLWGQPMGPAYGAD